MLSKDPYQPVDIMHPLLFKAQTSKFSQQVKCSEADSIQVQAFLGAGSKEMSDELSAFVEKHNIHPPIARVYEFEDADKAIAAAAKLTGLGKLVVKV